MMLIKKRSEKIHKSYELIKKILLILMQFGPSLIPNRGPGEKINICVSKTKINKSKIDNNEYVFTTLKNDLKVVITTNKVDKSAAALSVRTGSDDDTIPGIAHFLEHMLFMGTEAFPDENDFMNFLSKHNGHSNAYTKGDLTVYYFEIDPEYFEEALIKFSHFFRTPLLKKDSVDREINAVDSEFKNGLNKDNWRCYRMTRSFMCDAFSTFNVGNNTTLKIEGIRDKVYQFYKENYCSSKMCLSIFHDKDNTDLIAKNFGDISQIKVEKIQFETGVNGNNNFWVGVKKAIIEGLSNKNNNFKHKTQSSDVISASDIEPIFKKEYLNRLIHIEPIADVKKLQIYIQVPKKTINYKHCSYNFMKYLLKRKNKGSLIHELKEKSLAHSLDIYIDFTVKYSVFEIYVDLTATGCKNIEEVLFTIKNYFINLEFDNEEFFNYKKSRKRTFEYLENMKADKTVIKISENMQYYDIENILNHDYMYEKFYLGELSLIKNIIEDQGNWLVFLLNKDKFNQKTKYSTEKYYNIKYIVEENQLVLSTPNKVFENENGRYCFIYNSNFKAPKTCVTILLNKKISKVEYLPFMFYISLAKESFFEKYDDFLKMSNLSVEVKLTGCGIEIEFYGFNNNLCLAIDYFFAIFFSLELSNFDLIKIMLKDKNIAMKNKSPYLRLFDSLFETLNPEMPSVDNLLKSLETIKEKDVFIFKDCYLEMFVSGNNSSFTFEKLYDNIRQLFSNKEKYRYENNYKKRLIAFESEDPINNAVCVIVKFDNKSNYTSNAINQVILDYCKEDFFDILRTKETLGYIVIARNFVFNGTNFLYFVVQSEKSCEFLEERILRFIKNLCENLKNIKKEDFKSLQKSVISSNNEELKNLKAFHHFYKDLFFVDAFDLDYKKNMINEVSKLTVTDLVLPSHLIIVKGRSKK